MNDLSKNMGYRLINDTNLKIVSKCILVDSPFLSSNLQYVTSIVDASNDLPLTPTFSVLVYDEKTQIFRIEDYIELPFQLIHISLFLDLELNVIGNTIYNDYFDGVDYISGLGNYENHFAPYEYYKYDIYLKILADKERRSSFQHHIDEENILKYSKKISKGV